MNVKDCLIYAKLAQASYNKEKPVVIDGWKRITFYESPSNSLGSSNGLAFSVFKNASKTAIVYRGTKVSSNLLSDIEILKQSCISTADEAQQYYQQHSGQFSKEIIFVGHSLGAVLATIMSLRMNKPAVLFDTPGSYTIASNLPYFQNHRKLIISILGTPNLINTFHKHVGTLLFADTVPIMEPAIIGMDSLLQFMSPIANSTADLSLALNATFALHRMKYFVEYLSKTEAVLPYISKWCNWCVYRHRLFIIPHEMQIFSLSHDPVINIVNPLEDSISTGNGPNPNPPNSPVTYPVPQTRIDPNFSFPSRISKINSKFSYNEWIVSVVNTVGFWTTSFGHAALIVEGIDPTTGQFFIGKYEMFAYITEQFHWFWNPNPKGVINFIGVNDEQQFSSYTDYPGFIQTIKDRNCAVHAYNAVPKDRVLNMISNIRQQKEEVLNGEILPYQTFGSGLTGGLIQAIFSDKDGGYNCAEWCMAKLLLAGIVVELKPKPSILAFSWN